MTTFGNELAEHKGIGPGFDTVRLVLAVSVLFIHCSLLWKDQSGLQAGPLFPYAPIARWAFDFLPVPMFFALSGFLVAASAERLPLRHFMLNRFLRIVPALAGEIILSALVLGPLLTAGPLEAYFRDPRFASYFLNIIGMIHYELPGLFLTNPQPNVVNGSLWTVPHEFSCYIVLAACVMMGLFQQRVLLLAATLSLFGIAIVVFLCDQSGLSLPDQSTLTYIFVTRGAARLVPVFMTGILFYRFRDRILYRIELAVIAAVTYAALSALGSPSWFTNPIFGFVTAPLLTYIVIYAGLSPLLKFKALQSGDYSYGIYLYGFPLQQALIHVFPGEKPLPLFFLLSLASSLAMAVISWHLIEKPVLNLRRRFSLAATLHADPLPVSELAPRSLYSQPAAIK